MDSLRIHLFGGLCVYRGGEPLPAFPTQKARGLFAYLALNHGRGHARSTLVGRFWGDAPERVARKNLRTDLWRVRTVLEPEGVSPGSCLAVAHDEVALAEGAGHWLDVAAFEALLDRAAAEGDGTAAAVLLREAAELYRGDLLEGVYDDWCVFERERLRLRYLDALERLIRHHRAAGEWAEAAECAQRLLHHDPLREQVHREVIRSHLARGDRAAAVRQFETCARLLRQELEVDPAPETRALVAPLLPAEAPRAAEQGGVPAETIEEVLLRLRTTAQWLEETGEQVRMAIRDVERARMLVTPSRPAPVRCA